MASLSDQVCRLRRTIAAEGATGIITSRKINGRQVIEGWYDARRQHSSLDYLSTAAKTKGQLLTARALSKSETVYRKLRERILTGRYNSGYRLVLDQLAREFTVSPVPVREAVRRLEAEGLVTFTPNVGAEVTGIDITDYADTMQVLAYLEGVATALAAPHLSTAHLDEAAVLNERMGALLGADFDPVRFTELNQQFHQLLCVACPNLHLLTMLDREWHRMSLIRRSSFTLLPTRPAESVVEHQRILDLLRSGVDANEIEHATREHTLRTMNAYLDVTRRPD